jgi:hypothetical protein
MINHTRTTLAWIAAALALAVCSASFADDKETVRVFIFAGQSNMVGSDSKVEDIVRFLPFAGLEEHQPEVKFSYTIGRENKKSSDGWVDLQPVNRVVGPELSFARKVGQNIDAPIAIIKCAAGGTHLGGDWNPDEPDGLKMYPLALGLIRSSLAEFDKKKIPYRIEGVMWHQGENDMFEKDYMANYGENLANLLAKWRRDLVTPDLKFYIGELCTKTIWGMDLRPRMYAISKGQKAVTGADPLAEYIPTAHIGVEIGGGVGLHYHYGTLGQLEHGVNYADAYLRTIGKLPSTPRPLKKWPYEKGRKVRLFVLAGHRNMEGERAFVQELEKLKPALLVDDEDIAYKYGIGGGYKVSDGWEPLGPAGYYDTFGPELSFGHTLKGNLAGDIAIAKFTHSGSQIIDWTPEGSMAKSRNLYPQFIAFVKEAVGDLEAKGHEVELAGAFYHIGENDMSFSPYRKDAPERLRSIIAQSRVDLSLPTLNWYVSQQPPTDDKGVNAIDVTRALEEVAASDDHLIHLKAFDLPEQEKKLVLDTAGILRLGEVIAEGYLKHLAPAEEKANWRKHVINDRSPFEAVGVADFNGDGSLDVFSGDSWYQAPKWTRHKVREVLPGTNPHYHEDFADLPLDVNGDGRMDIVTCAYFSRRIAWLEHPGDPTKPWSEHEIDTPGSMETAILIDVNGDGKLDLLPNIGGTDLWYEITSRKPTVEWRKHRLNLGGGGPGHGIGSGDINQDGRVDILNPNGWYEHPKNSKDPWTFHQEFVLGSAGIQIIGRDFDGDGDTDIVWGMGHAYGLYWLEQKKDADGKRTWHKAAIDESFSQVHTLLLADLDGDKQPEVVTGKRVYAHEVEPGATDAPCIYSFRYDREKAAWSKTVIYEGKAALNAPKEAKHRAALKDFERGSVGTGLSMEAQDMDRDGDIDLVCPGKSGLYWLENPRGSK